MTAVQGDAGVDAMTVRTATRIVTVVLLSAAVCLAAGLVFFAQARAAGRSDSIFSFIDLGQQLLGAVAILLTGAVVSTRRPGNRIGWLCLAAGAFGLLGWAAEQYAAHALVIAPGSLPGGIALAVATEGAFAPSFVVLILLVLLFPDGHLLSARWRPVPLMAIVAFSGLWVVGSLRPLSAPFKTVENPIDPGRIPPVVFAPIIALLIILAVASALGTFASIAVRFRRSRGDEREQLKWLLAAAAVLPLGLVAHSVADAFAPGALGTIELLFSFAIFALPVSIGIAVLKYRLYEIDRIISRTLVYGGLTVVLGAVYIGLVLVGQALFSSFAGGSNLAIAASTLAVAALFLPARSRVQRFVDRRFYRRRYDAQRTLEGFGTRLREQVDLETLNGELRGIVQETMQPAHVSVWRRTGTRR